MHTRQAIAPGYKGIANYDDDKLEVLRDSQIVSSDNLSGSSIQLFPRSTVGQTEADANYTKNPLPGDRPYDIVGIGFELNHAVLFDNGAQTLIDATGFMNEFFDAAVFLRTDQRREELVNKHLHELIDMSSLDVAFSGDAGNQDFQSTAKLPSNSLRQIDDPIHISTQEVFELEVRWASTSAFPSNANWNTFSQGGPLKLIAMLQVAYKE